MTAFLRRLFREHPLVTFLPLAFALSWYPWLIALAQGRSTGPNPLGPFAAALLVTAIGLGWRDVKAQLARLVRGRVALRWYALALGLPVALVAACVGINAAFGAPWPTAAQLAGWPELVEKFLFIFLFIALGEEPGWRGFLLPRLAQRLGWQRASLVLGVIWAVWHVPLLGGEIGADRIVPFLIGVVAAAYVLTWLFAGTGGSVLLPMLMHATVNTVGAGFAFQFVAGAAQTRLWWINAVVWSIAAAVAAWRLRNVVAPAPSMPDHRSGAMERVPAAAR
jgi:membrane protease YdiL (CAAX protease family)